MKEYTLGTEINCDDSIVRFYAGKGTDSGGRTIEEVWDFGYRQLEIVHDYIQWLFPLPKPSAYNPEAPLLTPRTALAFRTSEELRGRLSRSIELMLRFYGFETARAADGGLRIGQTKEFSERSRNWITPHNHNHLRLTRILESTRLLGCEEFSRALLTSLEEISILHVNEISIRTVDFWRNAAGS
jgi:hypothetical protein